MASLKQEILDRLWVLEAAINDEPPEVREQIGDTIRWLGQDKDRGMTNPIRDALVEARRLLDTGRKSAALRELRGAIREVSEWL